MIRRKIQEKTQHISNTINIDRNSLRPQVKQIFRPHKFNYQLQQFDNYHQFAQHSTLSQHQNGGKQQAARQENCCEKGKIMGDTLLRRKELYNRESSIKQQKKKNDQNDNILIHDKTTNKSSARQLQQKEEVSKLREESINKVTRNINIQESHTGKTIRKKDQFCSCSRVEPEHHNHNDRIEISNSQILHQEYSPQKNPTEQDLDLKYQQIWQSNQEQKNQSFSQQMPSFSQQNTFYQHHIVPLTNTAQNSRTLDDTNVIINTRTRLRKQYPEQHFQKKLNYRYGWDTSHNSVFEEIVAKQKEDTDRILMREQNQRARRRYSVEKRQTRRNSPVGRSRSRRIDYGVSALDQSMIRRNSEWARPSNYVSPLDLPQQLPPYSVYPPYIPPQDPYIPRIPRQERYIPPPPPPLHHQELYISSHQDSYKAPPPPQPLQESCIAHRDLNTSFHEKCVPCPDPCISHEEQVRLKMVQDFSSKISLRIRQLTISMQKMRQLR